MHKGIKSFVLALILIVIFTVPVFAASSTFFNQAKNYYNRYCKLRRIPDNIAIQCFVFDKVEELDSAISSLSLRITNTENINSAQDQQILDLQNKNASQDAEITDLRNQLTPTNIQHTWFSGVVSRNEVSGVFDASGYRKLTFTYLCIDNDAAISIQTSNDGVVWINQYLAVQSQCRNGGSVSLDIAGKYYRAGTSMDHGSPMSISAFSVFFK